MLPLNYYNTGVTVELGDIVASGVNIWDFDYPVPAKVIEYNGKTATVPFDKKVFEQKIIDHYRFRQIGQETVGRWLHYFRTRIKEIMPYYIQLYEFEAKWFNVDDPLESYNLTETFQQDTTGTGTQKSAGSSENTGTNKFSDTPQGELENLDKYLTNATVTGGTVTDSSDSSSTNTGNTTHTLVRKGNIGVQPLGGEVKNIRDAFINIDLMVINELKDLFIQIY